MSADVLGNILAAYPEAHRTAVAFGRLVVIQLHHVRNDCTDLTPLEIDFTQLRKAAVDFMSHCEKVRVTLGLHLLCGGHSPIPHIRAHDIPVAFQEGP